MSMKGKGFIPISELSGRYWDGENGEYYVNITDKKQYYWRLNRAAQSKMIGGYAEVSINTEKRMIAMEPSKEKTKYTLRISKSGAIVSKRLKVIIEGEMKESPKGKYKMEWNKEGYFVFGIGGKEK